MIVLIFADYTFLQSNGKYFYLIHGAYSDNEGIAKIKIGLPAGSYQLITAIQNSNWYQNIQVHSTLKVTA